MRTDIALEDGVDHVRGSDSAPSSSSTATTSARTHGRRFAIGGRAAAPRYPVRVPYFPLTEIHPHALRGHRGQAAALQGLFWDARTSSTASARSRTTTHAYAGELGLDEGQFERDLSAT
jgi:hypothetical protein